MKKYLVRLLDSIAWLKVGMGRLGGWLGVVSHWMVQMIWMLNSSRFGMMSVSGRKGDKYLNINTI